MSEQIKLLADWSVLSISRFRFPIVSSLKERQKKENGRTFFLNQI